MATTVATTPVSEWKEKLDTTPPKKTVGGMKVDANLADVEQSIRDDGMEEYLVQQGVSATDEQKIVHFLHGAELDKNAAPEDRKTEVRKFLVGDAKKRMMDILKKDSDTTHSPDNVGLWRKIQGVVLRYSEQEGAVTIFDGKNMPVALRAQATKNCYQHAVGGTVGYKIAFGKGDNDHKVHTVDVAKFVRHSYDAGKLKRRVLENKGGKSQKLLEKMVVGTGLQIGNTICSLRYAAENVTEYGPALVSRFSTDLLFKAHHGDYVNENGTFRIHQFDQENERDTHKFFELGHATPEEREFVRKMEETNKKPEEDAASDPVFHTISQSYSSESNKEGGTETNSDLEGAGGLHAMILIGYRKEPNSGKMWFLIQNTWTKLPVFEASESYLAHHLKRRNELLEDGKLVFLYGTLQENATLPVVESQGLCLESNDSDDVAEVDEDDEEAEEEDWDSDNLEG